VNGERGEDEEAMKLLKGMPERPKTTEPTEVLKQVAFAAVALKAKRFAETKAFLEAAQEAADDYMGTLQPWITFHWYKTKTDFLKVV